MLRAPPAHLLRERRDAEVLPFLPGSFFLKCSRMFSRISGGLRFSLTTSEFRGERELMNRGRNAREIKVSGEQARARPSTAAYPRSRMTQPSDVGFAEGALQRTKELTGRDAIAANVPKRVSFRRRF